MKDNLIDNEKNSRLSDEDLVREILQNHDYFLLLIKRYKEKLFNYIRRITNISKEEAEDLLQEIFLKVYLNLNSFDRGLKFSSWIYSIARNHVISSYRKKKARPEGYSVSLENENLHALMSDIDLQKKVDLQIGAESISHALNKLKEKYREILILKYFEEKSYEEISDIIKKPVGTVGSMLNKAKSELKKELQKTNI